MSRNWKIVKTAMAQFELKMEQHANLCSTLIRVLRILSYLLGRWRTSSLHEPTKEALFRAGIHLLVADANHARPLAATSVKITFERPLPHLQFIYFQKFIRREKNQPPSTKRELLLKAIAGRIKTISAIFSNTTFCLFIFPYHFCGMTF
jgi:hypothetical protein